MFLRSAGPGADPRGADLSGARIGGDFSGASSGGALLAGLRGNAAIRNVHVSGAVLRHLKGWDGTPGCDALVHANSSGTAPVDRSEASPNPLPRACEATSTSMHPGDTTPIPRAVTYPGLLPRTGT